MRTELVVVGDDCALPNRSSGIAGRRGVAGTVFVHKIAGAAAAAGEPLAAVAQAARDAAAAAGTMGVALRSCTLPGKEPTNRIGAGMMEVGLGIHGEPGAETLPLAPADAVVDTLLKYIASTDEGRGYMPLPRGERIALLVNNLGGATGLELAIATRRAVAALRGDAYGLAVERVYVGTFMSALDMSGISITLLRIGSDRLLGLLDAPAAPAAWPASAALGHTDHLKPPALPAGADVSTPPPPPSTPPVLDGAAQAALGKAIGAAAGALVAHADELTRWDTLIGDGDCGDTLAAGGRAIADDVGRYPLGHPAATAVALSVSIGRSMAGSSGALYRIFASAAAASLGEFGAGNADAGASRLAVAFRAGCDAVGAYGGASSGDRTMLDALLPAADALDASTAKGAPVSACVAAAARAAMGGAEQTKAMAARAGRASYVPADKLAEVPDPGAMAVAFWLAAAAEALA